MTDWFHNPDYHLEPHFSDVNSMTFYRLRHHVLGLQIGVQTEIEIETLKFVSKKILITYSWSY